MRVTVPHASPQETTMQRSTKRILTTHVGSLPQPPGLDTEAMRMAAVADVVRKQREVGLDIINEGEYTKGGDWLSYVDYRFGGFSERPRRDGIPLILQGKDREEFAESFSRRAALPAPDPRARRSSAARRRASTFRYVPGASTSRAGPCRRRDRSPALSAAGA